MQKMSKTEKQQLYAVDSTKQELVSALLEKYEGFSVVFRYLAELQKPLILHNCFLDLILIYKQVCKTSVAHFMKMYQLNCIDLYFSLIF